MATQVERGLKMLAYDGDCPMCTSTVALLIRAGLVYAEQARSNRDLSEADLSAVEAAGIRNQLVVLDPVTRETRAGTDALLWIIGDNKGHPWWVRVLSLPGIRQLIRIKYQIVSYNRRVISPPRHRVRCDCEPEATLARRLALVVPLAMITLAITALFGAAAFVGCQLGSAATGAVLAVAVGGGGWVLMAAAALLALRGEQRIDYIAHLVVTAYVGALVLLPAALAMWWLSPAASVTLASLSALAGFVLVFRMQRRRVAYLNLPDGWLWMWFGTVTLGLLGALVVVASIAAQA